MGAWIETNKILDDNDQVAFAPHVGAWIETKKVSYVLLDLNSRPTWARGLKPPVTIADKLGGIRAPRGRVD